MRVALVKELGGINSVELSEWPDPTPAAGQEVVRVRAAGLGPWDVKLISGAFGAPPLPYIPGFEVAGVVESMGDGVDVQPGDQVYANLAGGGFADRALVSVDHLAHKPDGLSFEEAAGLVVGGGTAYEGLVDRGGLQAGETVLITAAAGGVGSVAVQIAAAVGPAHSASPARATTTTCWASARATRSTTMPPTGSSRSLPRFPAASTCSSTAPAARPGTEPSVRCARAAGRYFW